MHHLLPGRGDRSSQTVNDFPWLSLVVYKSQLSYFVPAFSRFYICSFIFTLVRHHEAADWIHDRRLFAP